MDLRKLLQDVKDGSTNIDDALSSLKNLLMKILDMLI
mgnify:CR=1 FL=1